MLICSFAIFYHNSNSKPGTVQGFKIIWSSGANAPEKMHLAPDR
jgi:hypothetical protein